VNCLADRADEAGINGKLLHKIAVQMTLACSYGYDSDVFCRDYADAGTSSARAVVR
jgi:hypothetical protein